MIIRDTIHGNVEFDDTSAKILDLPEMQRLRGINQLGFDYFVYPGANHTRFEHSIGSMHITNELIKNIWDGKNAELGIVALIHDVGHGPFSHQSEDVIMKFTKKSHEQHGEQRIRNSRIKDYIQDSGMSFRKVMEYFKGGESCEIVGGALGSDRIDYIMRDAYYTGVAYGMVDYNRLKSKLTVYKGMPAIYQNGVSAAELMLIARYFMFEDVYGHHVARIGEGMFQNGLRNVIENGEVDANVAANMMDAQAMECLRRSKGASGIAKRLDTRNLFKRAYYQAVERDVKVAEVENALGKAGFSRDDYVVSFKGFGAERGDVAVLGKDGAKIGTLNGISPLMKAIDDIVGGKKRLLVACDKKNVVKARTAVLRLL